MICDSVPEQGIAVLNDCARQRLRKANRIGFLWIDRHCWPLGATSAIVCDRARRHLACEPPAREKPGGMGDVPNNKNDVASKKGPCGETLPIISGGQAQL